MSEELNIRFIQSETLGHSNSLENVLKACIDVNFDPFALLVGSYVTERYAYWRKFDDTVFAGLNVAYQKGMLEFHLIDKVMEPGYPLTSLTVRLKWPGIEHPQAEEDISVYSSDPSLFRSEKYYPERHCWTVLDLAKKLYHALRPAFGWIEICRASGYTSLRDVEELRIPHIYWANFFGPTYAEKLGRPYLEKAPGWRIEFLEDGGCLYVLSPTMKLTGKVLAEQVKQYFSVGAIRKIKKA